MYEIIVIFGNRFSDQHFDQRNITRKKKTLAKRNEKNLVQPFDGHTHCALNKKKSLLYNREKPANILTMI